MPAWRGVRSALRLLHPTQANTQFVQLDTPPWARGTMWSIVSSPIPGWVPSLLAPPPGCRFAPRCALVRPECRTPVPVRALDADHRVACFAVETF